MAMSLISGVTQVTLNGVVYAPDDSSVKFEMSSINREPVVSKNGRVFSKVTPQAAKLSFSAIVPGDVDVSSFQGMSDVNIVVQCANGSTLNAPGFASSGNNEYDSNEGKISLEFYGPAINVTLGS